MEIISGPGSFSVNLGIICGPGSFAVPFGDHLRNCGPGSFAVLGSFADLKLRCGWEFNYMPTVCVCGNLFDADHAVVCMRGVFIIQRHNKIRDLEAEILQVVCTDVGK